MTHPCSLLAALLLPATSLLAQDLLHYKFDEHCSAELINFAAGSPVGNATLQSTYTGGVSAARITGQFDQAMTATSFPLGPGSAWASTGWAPSAPTGTFSFSMWLRNRPGNPNAIQFGYLFGANGGNFRLFTGTSGRLFLSGFPGGATSAADITSLLNAGWVHVACTVNGPGLQATWYVNGVADPAVTVTQPVSINGTNFGIGARDSNGSNPSPLETDEFVLSTAVWTPAEVLALSQAPRAGDGDYTAGVTQCGAGNVALASSGGAPAIGNVGYALSVSTTTPSLFVLIAGFDRCTLSGVLPLPLDGTSLLPLLAGCWIVADAPVTLSGLTTAGPATLPLPILPTVPLALNIYTQALALDLTTFASSMSNGFATSTGL